MKTIYEQMGGTYSWVGDYYLPNMDIKLPGKAGNECTAQQEDPLVSEAPGDEASGNWIGKYGLMRRSYLKEHRPVLYAEMIRTGKLHEHLAEVSETCSRQVEMLTAQMAKREGITEALKAADPMVWVARMNSIQNRAEEIVLREYIYA
ncbi:MAG: TnpV protein [Oscillospiraceae bacterium]|nr:TnpV protein [Oscillospiraceae bacterium]